MWIGQSFYGATLPSAVPYILGIGELLLSFALLIGAVRTISYGLALLVHTITILVCWRQLLDPYGLAKVGNHLWIATWPAWGGFIALFVMRQVDIYTVDRWREARS